MKKISALILLAIFSTPSIADDNKSGFWAEFGIGGTKVDWENSYSGGGYGESDNGIATTLKLGYGFSESFQLYYMNNVSWTTDSDDADGIFADGITGLGANLWVSPEVYFSLGAGIGVINFISTDDDYDSESDDGSAFSLGVGYEFAKHHNIKLDFFSTNIELDSATDYEADILQLFYIYSLY